MSISGLNTVLLAAKAAQSSSADLSFGERLAFGGQVFVVGIGTVFSVLILLFIVLKFFKLFAYDIPEKRKKALAEKAAKEEKAVEAPAPETVEVAPATDDGELIAVITAAIEAYNSANGNALPFRVVSFKRVKGANGWNNQSSETF